MLEIGSLFLPSVFPILTGQVLSTYSYELVLIKICTTCTCKESRG